MPHISISLYSGRDKSELEKISKDVQDSLVKNSEWEAEDISVSIEEIEADKYISQVQKKVENEKLIIKSKLIK